METIDASLAQRKALYRLVKVLKQELAAEVAILNDTENVANIPADDSYYVAGMEQDIERVLTAKTSACFIYPIGPSVVESARSGDGTQRAKLHITEYRIVFMFKKPAGFSDYIVEGRKVTLTELVFHLSDRIMGGALKVVYKHAQNSEDIHEVEVTNQYADVITTNNNELTGRAILEVQVLQDVFVPMSRYSIT
jgi:hypothetical protein